MMQQMTEGRISWLRWCFYGCVNTVIALFGIAANCALLGIIAHFPDMRKQSINIYLTVLALYDNGVLIFSILMLNIPAIADYHSSGEAQPVTLMHPPITSSTSSVRYATPMFQSMVMSLNESVITTAFPLPYYQDDVVISKKRREELSCNSSHLLSDLQVHCFANQSSPSYIPLGSDQIDRVRLDLIKVLLQQALLRLHRRKIKSPPVVMPTESATMIINLLHSAPCRETLIKSIQTIDTEAVHCRPHLSQMAHLLNTTYHAVWLYLDKRSDENEMLAMQPEEEKEEGKSEEDEESEITAEASVSATSHNSNPLPYYVKVVYPLALFSQTGSIWTTCLITIERYLAVCHPLMSLTLSTRSRAISALTLLSILALVFNLPRFMEVDTSGDSIRPTELRRNTVYYYVYYICLNLTLNYIIPLSLLSALNIKIYASVRQANAHRNELTRARQSELHLASMLMLIVAIFIACNAPAFIINCLELHFGVGDPVVEVATIFSNVLVCFNSAINFVIYCIFGKRFRAKLYQALGCGHRTDRRTHRFRYVTSSAAAPCRVCRDLVNGTLNGHSHHHHHHHHHHNGTIANSNNHTNNNNNHNNSSSNNEEGRFLTPSPSSSGTNHHSHHHNHNNGTAVHPVCNECLPETIKLTVNGNSCPHLTDRNHNHLDHSLQHLNLHHHHPKCNTFV